MAKYRVITIAMTVKNNRIAEFNQIVDDSELTTNPSLLIEEGFIELVEEDDVIDIESEVVETKEVEETETEKVEVEEVKEEVTEVVDTKEVVSKKDEVKDKLASKK
jgi:hypothetical protein